MRLRKLNPLNDFTDQDTKKDHGEAIALALQNAAQLRNDADKLRDDVSPRSAMRSACQYLALAQSYPDSSAKLFHFAGHQFRRAEQYKRAAECYENSGIIVFNALLRGEDVVEKDKELGTRAVGRAKNLYSELGDAAEADRTHILGYDLLRKDCSRSNRTALKRFLLALWSLTSRYGTSVNRWIGSLVVILCILSLTYLTLMRGQTHFHKAPDEQSFPAVSALYFAVVTTATVGYGDHYPISAIAQFVVILNIVCGYVLLGTGATFLTRR